MLGDLRFRVTQANANGGADTINFSLPAGPQTITLGSALPTLSGDTTITNSTGSANLTVTRGAGAFAILTVGAGTTTASLTGVRITGGSGTTGGGISITAATNVSLTDVVVTTNTASTAGGGIYNGSTGTLTLTNSVVSTNSAPTGPASSTTAPGRSRSSARRSPGTRPRGRTAAASG